MSSRREEDARRFRHLDENVCMLCEARGLDMRGLWIDCFYAISEVVPEVIDIGNLGLSKMQRGYYLRICKTCRAELLGWLGFWADACKLRRGLPKDSDGELYQTDPERNIPIRLHGATRMVTPDEWEQMYPGREPIRIQQPPPGP